MNFAFWKSSSNRGIAARRILREPARNGGRLALHTVIVLCAATALEAAPAEHIDAADLQAAHSTDRLIDNTAFIPGKASRPADEDFAGTLSVAESAMTTWPAAFKRTVVLGRNPRMFPRVRLQFLTVDGNLVPVTQNVIRSGSVGAGTSFWDVIVQPGRVWSEPGDGGWSRASFPFALVHSLEGETHNGLALFLYRGRQVSRLRFQIVQQTAPYYVADYFSAAGTAAAVFEPAVIDDQDALVKTYRASVADSVRFADWSELAAKVGAQRLQGFDSALRESDGVAAGLDYEGTFYLKYCRSAAGPLPWCDRARFGVWSATKALANETALLRLAQKYGPGVFDLKIRDYVPAAAAYPGWQLVRFRDAINMATGLGNGSTRREPNDAEDGYLDDSYSVWYESRSAHEKVEALLKTAGRYPWGPGEVTRYRDQDMFILGVAMDAYLKSREGPGANLWAMLEKEVYEPIGIHYAPTNRTLEAEEGVGQPLMAYGYYPTIGDIVKIARLYHANGRAAGKQILYEPGIQALSAGAHPRGLPTGQKTASGETTYFNAFWENRYRAAGGCELYVPVMEGWGGNLVALMPHGLTAVRLAKDSQDQDPAAADPTSLLAVGDRLAPFCH